MELTTKGRINSTMSMLLVVLCFVCFSCKNEDCSDTPILVNNMHAPKVTIPIHISFNHLTNMNNQGGYTVSTRSADDALNPTPTPITIDNVAIVTFDAQGKRINSSYYDQSALNASLTTLPCATISSQKVTVFAIVNAGRDRFVNMLSLDEAAFSADTIAYTPSAKGVSEDIYLGKTILNTTNISAIHLTCHPLFTELNLLVELQNNCLLEDLSLCNIPFCAYMGSSTTKATVATFKGVSSTTKRISGSEVHHMLHIRIGSNCTTALRREDAPYIKIKSVKNGLEYISKIYLDDDQYNVQQGNSYNLVVSVNNKAYKKKHIIFKYKVKVHNHFTYAMRFRNGFIGRVDWGDGTDTEQPAATSTNRLTHKYTGNGDYEVQVDGQWETKPWDNGQQGGKNIDLELTGENITLLSLGGGALSFRLDASTRVDKLFLDNDFFQASASSLTRLDNAFQNTSLDSIPAGLLANCSRIKTLSSMFSSCQSLKSVPAGLLDGCTGVLSTSFMFLFCQSLKSVPSDLFRKSRFVQHIDRMFLYCGQLTGELDLKGLPIRDKKYWNAGSSLKEMP